MNYQIDCGEKVFDVELQATSWHYEDNSIGSFDMHGFTYFDNRPKSLIVDDFEIVNKGDFAPEELDLISECLIDDEADVFEMLVEELENRLDNSHCTDDDDDY